MAVIDGSTSKTPVRIAGNLRNGRYSMLLVSEYLRHLGKEATCQEFCAGVTAFVHPHYPLEQQDEWTLHPENRMTASAIVYSRYRNEIWMVGDCQGMVNGKRLENGKPYEERIAGKRAALIRDGLSPAEARKAIVPLLIQAMRKGQNKTYAVIDGFPVFIPGVKVIACPRSPDTEIVLASDGYPFLRPTLEESERLLALQLQQDPQNIGTFSATKGLAAGQKSFDDRTYIRFRL